MRILVLGGDGYCGWPASLHFSDQGNEVAIVDNLSRRRIGNELSAESLTPLSSLDQRIRVWREVSGRQLDVLLCDIALDPKGLTDFVRHFKPDVIIHFAEQRSAPYSMKSISEKNYTLHNNLLATHNVLNAMVIGASEAHLIHLGSIGVYGYEDRDYCIPSNKLACTFETKNGTLASLDLHHPHDPGSIYHLSKALDSGLFSFYSKHYGLAITDLYQGVVWGSQTTQTRRHPALVNRFDYDGCYGTVLNRFLVQAAINQPLTVYGVGGQTRAFINIEDTLKCIDLAIADPPRSAVTVRHQATEHFQISHLAALVADMTAGHVEHIENPRVESEDHRFDVDMSYFIDHGLRPTLLNECIVREMTENIFENRNRVDAAQISPTIQWR